MSQSASASRTARSSATRSSGKGAERHRLAAGLGDRRGDDRAVAVVDRGRPQRLAEAPPARRRSRAPRPSAGARTSTLGEPAGRQHADLARADPLAAPQQRLAARDVGARIADELAGRDRAADLDRRTLRGLDQLGLLDHHDRIGTARDGAAGRDRGGGRRCRRRAPARGRRRSPRR